MQEVAAVEEGDVGGCHAIDAKSPCDTLDSPQAGGAGGMTYRLQVCAL